MPETVEVNINAAIPVTFCLETDAYLRLGPVLRYLIIGLVDQAFQVQLVSCDPMVSAIALGPVRAVIHPPLTWPFATKRTDQLLESVSEQTPQVVHALSRESYELAYIMAQEFDADLVLTISSAADVGALPATNRLETARLVALSEPLLGQLSASGRFAPESIMLARPGVLVSDQVACFANTDREAALMCATDLDSSGNVEVLIEALALLHRRGVDVLCFLLGQGPAEASLRQMARYRGLSGEITFARPAGDIGYAFRNSDVFVDASRDEAFQINTLRAMASGMCVVALHKHISDFLLNGSTSLVLARATPDCLAETLQYALANREETRRIAASGVEYIRTHHSVSSMADSMVNLYRQLAYPRSTFPINP